MKYLECAPITELDVILQSGVHVGEYVLKGRLEIYSCKLAPSEKRLASSLDKQLAVELPLMSAGGGSHSGSLEDRFDSHLAGPSFMVGSGSHSISQSISPPTGGLACSPLGRVDEASTRKLLINLILTLNNTFADYDFRDLKPEDFTREASLEMVQNSVNSKISRVEDEANQAFSRRLWASLDDEMSLKECEIYSYVNDMDDDALSVGKIWSVNYFFYNKKLKKLAFFACWIKSPALGSKDGDMDSDMDSDGMDFDMDGQD